MRKYLIFPELSPHAWGWTEPEHERAIIERLEQYFGRKPTQQEINLALDQARSF
jgi:hypothetical protein